MTPTQPSTTPRTDKEWDGYVRDGLHDAGQQFARTLETELAEARRIIGEQSRLRLTAEDGLRHMTGLKNQLHLSYANDPFNKDAELARLRADVEKATAKIANQAERIRYLEGATNHATGTPLSLATERAERAELALANARCPHIVSSNEGTHYCALAESTVAEARKDSQRFNLLASLIEDVNIGDIDPTKHRTEDNEWPDAWRDAIDAAMTNSNHKTT